VGTTGVKSKISKAVIHVESTPPQIYFNAMTKPNDNIPEFTTKEPVVAYVKDSHIDETLQKEIIDTPSSLINVGTQGTLDDGAVITLDSVVKYTLPPRLYQVQTASFLYPQGMCNVL